MREKSTKNLLLFCSIWCIMILCENWEKGFSKEDSNVHRKAFRFAYAVNFLFQVTVSLLTPAALLIGGTWLLYRYCGMGKWVVVLGAIFGLICGLYSMICFLLKTPVDPMEPLEKGRENRNGTKH